ncbi:hypothetical protein FIBSPDRAFT_929153 [Athelia psychrophila]|uniref:Uncharacterized protein n=1 Tax=Athelia psychrophila TaxID=1759441 RepID=A0A166P5S1_9AGAM|nr:hypothetical protein FIBSPDRAFT_929153 [Fibularhizoctonia sp. CBS 109695]
MRTSGRPASSAEGINARSGAGLGRMCHRAASAGSLHARLMRYDPQPECELKKNNGDGGKSRDKVWGLPLAGLRIFDFGEPRGGAAQGQASRSVTAHTVRILSRLLLLLLRTKKSIPSPVSAQFPVAKKGGDRSAVNKSDARSAAPRSVYGKLINLAQTMIVRKPLLLQVERDFEELHIWPNHSQIAQLVFDISNLTQSVPYFLNVLSAEVIEEYINLAKGYHQAQSAAYNAAFVPPTTAPAVSSPGPGGDAASSPASYAPDPHAVSEAEAESYYAGLPSEPTLVYRTGNAQWTPPRGPHPQRRPKELREVFDHPIAEVWQHDLAWKVVSAMDDHKILFTTIDVVRFKNVGVDDEGDDDEEGGDDEESEDEDEDADAEPAAATKPVLSPVTIWIGVFPGSATATAAHGAAQSVLALLQKYQITDVDVAFRASIYTPDIGPPLLKPVDDLDPLVDVVSPLTPALGLRISTRARPTAQGTMALYLAEGGGSDRLLGLSCRHVLIGSEEGNLDYSYHPGAPAKDVLLLGERAYADVVDSVKLAIGGHGIAAKRWKKQIERFTERQGNDAADAAKAEASRIKTEGLLAAAEAAVEALAGFLARVTKEWRTPDSRVIGRVLRAPPLALGVGAQRFTEDWAVFALDRAKLGAGFRGNKMDLGAVPVRLRPSTLLTHTSMLFKLYITILSSYRTEMSPAEFTVKCFPRGAADWAFAYPADRLLPLAGVLAAAAMRAPDTWDAHGAPCLLVAKRGGATGTTLGRATGVLSVVRDYYLHGGMSVHQTSLEWAILGHGGGGTAGGFAGPGDSGAVVADIRGRIGGMLIGGAGHAGAGSERWAADVTYATPFWWLLRRRIRASGCKFEMHFGYPKRKPKGHK